MPLVYYAFDLRFLEGKEPLSGRRKLLATALKKTPENIRLSKELQGTKDELLGSPKSLASKAWLPSDPARSTKAAGVVVPGSRSS